MDKGIREKNCLSDNERYADLINDLLLEGEQIIKAENLHGILDFIRYAKDKKRLKELVENDPAYQNMDEEAYDMVSAYTGAEELVSVKQNHESGGKVNMCLAIKEMLAEDIDIIHRICDAAEEVIPRYNVEKICKKMW